MLDFCNLYSDVHNPISMRFSFNYGAPSSEQTPNKIQSSVKLWSANKANDFPKNIEQCDIESLRRQLYSMKQAPDLVRKEDIDSVMNKICDI